MAGALNFYDILGVQSGAPADEVQRCYDAKLAVLAPRMIAGAPSKVIAAADRAREMLDLARSTLTDLAARHLYDAKIGILRPGTGLAGPGSMPSEPGWDPYFPNTTSEAAAAEAGLALLVEALAPHRRLSRRVVVPDARGLFVGPARRLMTHCGLRADIVQLTQRPLPVEGLVVDQSVPPGARIRRSSSVTVQVWHPAQQPGRGA